MQMILRYGRSGVRDEILTAKSVEMMSVIRSAIWAREN